MTTEYFKELQEQSIRLKKMRYKLEYLKRNGFSRNEAFQILY